jgi:hypothetical protein
MQARGFDGELRQLPGPPLTRSQLGGFVALLTGLAVFELASHLWLAR